MALTDDCNRLMKLYPKIFFACHTRHVRDPKSKQLVSAQQARIIDHLNDQTGTSVCELADHMGVTPSTLSLALDRLEIKGFVMRDRDPQDRRRVLVRLTEAGVRIRDAHSVLDPERVRGLLERLGHSERKRALDGL